MKKLTHVLLAPLALLVAGSCGSSGQEVRSDTPEMDEMTVGSGHCPTELPHTLAEVQDTADGVAIILSTAPEQVEDLRKRARNLANAYDERFNVNLESYALTEDQEEGEALGEERREEGSEYEAEPRYQAEREEEAEEAAEEGPQQQTTRISVYDTSRGAIITLTPMSPENKAQLRQRVRSDVTEMEGGKCPALLPER